MSSEANRKYKELSEKIFGHLDKEEIPCIDDVLRALMVAKGRKFALSPNLIERVAASMEDGQSPDSPTPLSCLMIDCIRNEGKEVIDIEDWCCYCDAPRDKCIKCDSIDCNPPQPDLH